MRRFKNILYFADGATEGCSALARAVTLARANNATLTVFDVVPEGDSQEEILRRLDVDIDQLLRKDREAEVDTLVASLRDQDISIRKRVVSGIPFVEVIRAVIDNGCDLVIKTARPPDSFAKRSLGSTELHLLRKCPCPIWIDRQDAAVPYKTVLAAVDPGDSESLDSGRLILDLASSLAKKEAANLAVIHVWSLYGESRLRSGRAGISSAELESLLEDTRERHRDRLGALLDVYGMTTDDDGVHLVKGDPAQSIRALSSELKADLVVMGTLEHRRIPGFFIGNTAEDVLQTTQASIIAIKPAGFVSPVKAE